jgi:tetratricopeptide (TPR) repeat protein
VPRFVVLALFTVLPCLATPASAADSVRLDPSGPDERLRIETHVNGHAVAVAMDTGLDCGYLLFRADLAQLGLRVPESPPSESVAPGKYPYILAPPCTWTLLGTTLKDIHPLVLTVPTRFLRQEVGLAGLVGWPTVRKNIWVLNLAVGRIGTAREVPAAATAWTRFQLKTDLRILSLTDESEPKKLPRILIDTGNADGILLPADAWRAWRAANPNLPTTISADWMVGQGERAEEQVWADKFVLGNIVVHDVAVQEEDEAYTNMSPGEPVIALGLAALQRLDVVLDGVHHQAFVRASPAPAPAFQHNRLGTEFLEADEGGSPQIAIRVLPGTPAAAAGIQPGDELLKVNGHPADREPYWKKPAGTKYALVLKRGDLLVPVTVVLRDLIGPKTAAAAGGKGAILAYRPSPVVLDRADDQFFLVEGLGKAGRGDYEGAIADYAEAIAVNPEFAPAYCARAECREVAGNFADAVADLDRAIALDPVYAEAYDDRGLGKDFQGDLAGAIADYDQAVALNPKSADTFNHRGETEWDEGKRAEARSDFDRAIELNPRDVEGLNDRAVAEDGQGDFTGAIADCDRAIALDPRDAKAFSLRGAGKGSVGDFTGAVADFSQAVALNPQDASAYRARGIARDASGDLVGALADYSNAASAPARTDLFLRFRISLVLRQLAMDEADRDLVEAVDAAEPGWSKTIGSYLLGTISESELLAQAKEGGEEGRSDRECEADYYVAMIHLLHHETAPARDFLLDCVATKASLNEEYMLARGELARLTDSSS